MKLLSLSFLLLASAAFEARADIDEDLNLLEKAGIIVTVDNPFEDASAEAIHEMAKVAKVMFEEKIRCEIPMKLTLKGVESNFGNKAGIKGDGRLFTYTFQVKKAYVQQVPLHGIVEVFVSTCR